MSSNLDYKTESDEEIDDNKCIHDCCEWEEKTTEQKNYTLSSNHKLMESILLEKDPGVPFWGNPKYTYDDDTTYTEFVEEVLDDSWFDHCINCTTAHARYYDDIAKLNKMRQFGWGRNAESRDLLRGYFVIVSEVGIHKFNISEIHICKEFVGNPGLAEIMPRWKLAFLHKHFRITDIYELPEKDSDQWTPYQNIEGGIDRLRAKSVDQWTLGYFLSYDEGRVRVTSKRVVTTTRNVQKPIKFGQDIYFVSDQGQYSDGYCWNHKISQKQWSSTDPNEKRMANLMRQCLIDDDMINGSGRVISADNKFCNLEFIQECRDNNIGIICASIPSKTAHLSYHHQHCKSEVKQWGRGQSELWECMTEDLGDCQIAIWNDSNPVFIVSNCTKDWNGWIERQTGNVVETYSVPVSALIYNYSYHSTDVQNQRMAHTNGSSNLT